MMIMDGKTVDGMSILPLDRYPLGNHGQTALHNHPQAGTKQLPHAQDGRDGKTAHMLRLPRGKETHVTIPQR